MLKIVARRPDRCAQRSADERFCAVQGALLLVLFQVSHTVEHMLTSRATGDLRALFEVGRPEHLHFAHPCPRLRLGDMPRLQIAGRIFRVLRRSPRVSRHDVHALP